MRRALRSESFRLVRRRMPWILLGTLGGVIAALYLLLWLSLEGAQDVVTAQGGVDELREMLTLREVAAGGGSGLVYLVAGIMTVIMSASIVATEYGWGTIRTVLPHSASRGAFIGAKLVVLLVFALLASLVGMAAALATSTVITVLAGLDASLGDAFVLRLVGSLGLTFVVSLPYMAIAFTASLLARSTAAGIGLGLAVFFLEAQVVQLLSAAGGVVETATDLLLTPNVEALMSLAGPDPSGGGEVARGFAVVGAYTVVLAALALWRFGRRDVVLN